MTEILERNLAARAADRVEYTTTDAEYSGARLILSMAEAIDELARRVAELEGARKGAAR